MNARNGATVIGMVDVTDEQINKAIAEHLGADLDTCHCGNSRGVECDNHYFTPHTIAANYCGDLNAMHEAKKTMTRVECDAYNTALVDLRSPPSWAPDSPHQSLRWSWGQPPRIEAEAFLRAVGLWSVGKWEEL